MKHGPLRVLLLVGLAACGTTEVCETIKSQDGSPSGFEVCYLDKKQEPSDGALNRADVVFCATGAELPVCDPAPGVTSVCTVDEDCLNGETCVGDGLEGIGCRCARPCGTDNNCPSDQICACPTHKAPIGPTVESNECLAGECRDEFDCGGESCGVSRLPGGGWMGTFCRSAKDECLYDAECTDKQFCGWNGAKFACLAEEIYLY